MPFKCHVAHDPWRARSMVISAHLQQNLCLCLAVLFLASPSACFSLAQLPLRSHQVASATPQQSSLRSSPVRGVRSAVSCASSAEATTSFADTKMAAGTQYPEMVVFDLDACLWDQEMYALDSMPSTKVTRQKPDGMKKQLTLFQVYGDLNGRGEGVTGVMSGSDKISLHKGALVALQEYHDGKYPGMKLAAASSADTPFAVKIGRQALTMLEVVPGVTVMDCLTAGWGGKDVNQIGRTPPLSSDKSATHFPILRDLTGVRYDKMLFFDDCNWGDHCTKVATRCLEPDTKLGPVTLKTPSGLRVSEWQAGMSKYAQERGGK